jgi:hypothetical protein
MVAMNPAQTAADPAVRVGRKKRTAHFTQIGNELLRNRALSFKARGILCHLLSHDEGWTIRVSELVRGGVDGEFAIRSGIRELIAAGYVTRTRVVHEITRRVVGWHYEVFDEPQAPKAATSPFPTSGLPTCGFSTCGKPRPKNTKGKNTNSENKDDSLRESSARPEAPCDGNGHDGFSVEEPTPRLQDHGASPEPADGGLLLHAEDELAPAKGFPWPQVHTILQRCAPELGLREHAPARDSAMKRWWLRNGKTVTPFEHLAQRVAASDFLMGRNGHRGRNGAPYPWSWIFARDDGTGELRADRVLAGFYDNDRMAFVLERRKAAAAPRLTRVIFTDQTTREVDLAEQFHGRPRYRLTGEQINGLDEAIDYADGAT